MSLEHWKKTFDPCIFFGVMHGLMDVGASLLGIEYTGMCNALDCVYVHSNVCWERHFKKGVLCSYTYASIVPYHKRDNTCCK